MGSNTSHIAVNGHGVIVKDHNHWLLAVRKVIEALIGHAAGCGAIAHQGNDAVILMQQGSCTRHA